MDTAAALGRPHDQRLKDNLVKLTRGEQVVATAQYSGNEGGHGIQLNLGGYRFGFRWGLEPAARPARGQEVRLRCEVMETLQARFGDRAPPRMNRAQFFLEFKNNDADIELPFRAARPTTYLATNLTRIFVEALVANKEARDRLERRT